VEENREKELLALKVQMKTDNRRHDETSLGIQRQISENCEKINKNETSIAVIAEAFDNLNLNIQQVDNSVAKEAEEH
jgi:hypothetical protein